MSIQSTISLMNNVTPALTSIVNSMNMVIATAYDINKATGEMVNLSSINAAKESLARATVEIEQMANATNLVEKEHQKYNLTASKSEGLLGGLKGKVLGLASAYAGVMGVRKLIEFGDELTNINARLNLIKSNSESLRDVQAMIFNSATNARGNYQAMADSVSKLGSLAGDAFNGTAEIVKFTELLNKNFKIGGAGLQEQTAAMYQLTQAMGSGRLQGDEFRSIMENAPLLAQSIAKSMGVGMAELRKMSSEGKITSDVIKRALFESADEIENKFRQMPKTFADIKTDIFNKLTMQLSAPLERLNKFANSSTFINFVNEVATGVGVLANVVGAGIELSINGFTLLSNVIDDVKYPLLGLIAVIGLYNGLVGVMSFLEGANAAIKALHAKETVSLTLAQKMYALATGKATLAQVGLDTALLSSPIFWIPAAIIAIITVLVMVINHINKTKNTSISAIGVVTGALNVGLAFIGNLFVGFGNNVLMTIETVINAFIAFAEFLVNVFNHPLESIVKLFFDTFSAIVGMIKSVAGVIDAVLGTDISGDLSNFQSDLDKKVNSMMSKDRITLERAEITKLERFDYGRAYNHGYNLGASVEESLKNKFNELTGKSMIDNLLNKGQIIDPLSQIADNTKGIDDKLNKIDWENNNLSGLKGLMETRAINDLSKEIVLQVTNEFNGNVNSNVDMDKLLDESNARLLRDLQNSIHAG